MSDDDPGASEQTDAAAHEREGGGRWWKVAAVVAVVAAVASMATLGYLLLAAGDDEPSTEVRACILERDFTKGAKPNCPPKGAPFVDGLVQDATSSGFDIVTLDGEKESIKIRPADRPYIDVQHAQLHASQGQPIRIYTQRIDGERVIVYLTDPPLEP